ncbi:MAG TPA: hypothetical protein V6D20_13960 [Candidatus Obscuribacterales bacterium]
MRNQNSVSACRHCQHYVTEGRRGGQCQQLGSPVKGSWRACSLALPPFAPTWESMGVLPGGIAMWSEPVFALETEELPDCEIVAHSELTLACMTEVEADVA